MVRGYYLRVIINSGAEGNFILTKIVTILKFATLTKRDTYELVTTNRSDISNNR